VHAFSQAAIHWSSPQTVPERAVCPAANQVSQISTQVKLDDHTSDASGHKEITTEEKAITELCTALLVNVGSLYYSYAGFFLTF